MKPICLEPLDARRLLSGGDFSSDSSGVDFDDLLLLAKNYNSDLPVAFGPDFDGDGRLSYAEQYALAQAGVIDLRDLNGDGTVDPKDLHVPGRNIFSPDMLAVREDVDSTDYRDPGRIIFDGAELRSDGTLVVGDVDPLSARPVIEVTRNGKYIDVLYGGKREQRVAVKDVRRIEVWGDDTAADAIRVHATGKPTLIYARGGNDTIYGSSGVETIYGGDGDDEIRAGGGDDAIFGVNGNDRLWGDAGDDRVDGGAGKDRLDGGKGKNKLAGNGGTDHLSVRPKDKTDRDKKDKLKELE